MCDLRNPALSNCLPAVAVAHLQHVRTRTLALANASAGEGCFEQV
jgi:hypothetical protein